MVGDTDNNQVPFYMILRIGELAYDFRLRGGAHSKSSKINSNMYVPPAATYHCLTAGSRGRANNQIYCANLALNGFSGAVMQEPL
jgi:hypothetical protein